MQSYGDWEFPTNTSRVPLPHEDFDTFFEQFPEADNLLNETLVGIQDLDVPSGFANQETKNNFGNQPKHGRKPSGTAIFGFIDHNRELSINGVTNDFTRTSRLDVETGTSIAPGDLLRSLECDDIPSSSYEDESIRPKPLLFTEHEEMRYEMEQKKKEGNEQYYIITNSHPKSYKFPPTTAENSSDEEKVESKVRSINLYSAKYLQELNGVHADNKSNTYVDDFEPLIDDATSVTKNLPASLMDERKNFEKYTVPATSTRFKNEPTYKYVPIPIQRPIGSQGAQEQNQVEAQHIGHSLKSFLPPPSSPSLSNGSPTWKSSPEPQSPTPIRTKYERIENFGLNQRGAAKQATSQFFSDGDNFDLNQEYLNSIPYEHMSSPICQRTLNSSPIRSPVSSPRKAAINDEDTIEGNTTIQLSPTTPQRNKVILEWSPVISPNAKTSKDVRIAIQQSSPRRRVNKTSLLPPGELDQYWEGPDENKTFICTYKNCGKKFTRRYNVRSHIQTHLSDRPFGCSYCPKRFVRQHDLNRHIKGHLEATYCKCICGKEFSRLDALKKHRARNICIGGIANTENNSISKPHKRAKPEILDLMTTTKLAQDIKSSISSSDNDMIRLEI